MILLLKSWWREKLFLHSCRQIFGRFWGSSNMITCTQESSIPRSYPWYISPAASVSCCATFTFWSLLERTRVHSREIGELWRTWLTFSYLSLIGELTPQYVIFWILWKREIFSPTPLPSSSRLIKSWIQHETHTWRHGVLLEQVAPVFSEGWNWSKVFDGSLFWWNFRLDNVPKVPQIWQHLEANLVQEWS